MKQYFYLHIWTINGLNSDVDHLGLKIDSWPEDDIFSISPYFFSTERLRAILQKAGFAELSFIKIQHISKGSNFKSNYPDAKLPPFYWQIKSTGTAGVDDFSIWDDKYLIVSDKALKCLRDNHVSHAEADLIDIPFHDYFDSSRKYFWMAENVKAYFIQKDRQKKN